MILSFIFSVLSSIFLFILSAMLTASVNGESAETESYELVVVSSLPLLQAAKKEAMATMANNFFVALFF